VSINKRLIEFRKNRKMSQQNVADLLGVARQTISNIENEKHSPSSEILIGLFKVFPELNHRWLMFGENGMENELNSVSEPIASYGEDIKDKYIRSLESENKLLKKELDRHKDCDINQKSNVG